MSPETETDWSLTAEQRFLKYEAAIAALRRAQALDRKGGPIRSKKAASEREHARLWIVEIDLADGLGVR